MTAAVLAAAPAAPAPAVFRSAATAPERTLLDVLAATAAVHPQAAAVDDGSAVLTYRALTVEVEDLRRRLAGCGIGVGDRIGVRLSSGTAQLYVAILAVLAAGAAYVPVDADDPDERAELVFGEAGVSAVLTDGGAVTLRGTPRGRSGPPGPDDDAWIIFTSGSTGKPKGVAVSHRAAAAFVDAEARLFCLDEPIGPGDRVLAGLSVAFDASCEEMWLAWRHGACLVPAPRSLVRTGVDLGPWLAAQRITVVSTVPTLAALWPAGALEDVRLMIFGGEACPPELAERMAVEGREVWNTYGPTEATVVACAAPLTGDGPVRIGLPLAGWELAVVDAAGEPVTMGGTGELVISGVGLARYLDPAKDAEKFAPLPALGWPRAYRSGDVVRAEPAGLLFLGRADEQVKLGGRRIELGEVDAALQALPGVRGAAAAVRRTRAGNQVLVGYVAGDDGFDADGSARLLRDRLPAALVPLIAVVDELPTRTSGKVDRHALPWPLPATGPADPVAAGRLTPTEAWLAAGWEEILGVPISDPTADFFTHGGGSLTAAQLVALIRTRHPQISVSDLYRRPQLGRLAARLDASDTDSAPTREVTPTPRRTAIGQAVLLVPMLAVVGLRWTTVAAALSTVAALAGAAWAPAVPWWTLALAWLLLFSPAGRIAIAAGGARLLLRRVRRGSYPRGGSVHLRLWAATRLAELSGATSVAGASWTIRYARALGATVGDDVDLHSAPPVTGMLKLGRGAAVEPEVDLAGHWVDGDVVHVGRIRIGAGARVGARSTLMPGARVGKGAEVVAGSTVRGAVPAGQRWSGSPAQRVGRSALSWPASRPPRSRFWVAAYGVTATLLGLLPAIAALPGLALIGAATVAAPTVAAALRGALLVTPLATLGYLLGYGLLVLVAVRALARGLVAGYHPVHSRLGWQVWATERLMGLARVGLYPLYASLFTARLAAAARGHHGARGRGVHGDRAAVHDHRRRRRVPGRRHHGRHLRAGRRLAARRPLADRQAGVPGQLRDDRGGPLGAQARPGRGAVGGPGKGQEGLVVPGYAADAAAPGRRARRGQPHLRAAAPAEAGPRRRRAVPVAAGDVLARAGRAGARRAADGAGRARLAGRGAARRPAAAGRRVRRGRAGHRDEVAAGRAAARGRAAAVELLRVAQRAGRHVRRDAGRAVAGRAGQRHPGAHRLAAHDGGPDRARSLAGVLLAARGGSGAAGRRGDGEPGLRRADPPVP